jgi:UDP-2,3-diacylglucosamine pyrophosphatase LpxH
VKRREFVQRAAALGLTAASTTLQRLLAAPVGTAEVRGHVVCAAQPVPGVRVSDGFRVASTDASGHFVLTVGPDSGPFLFVTVPAGYWTNEFHVLTALATKQSPLFRLNRRGPDEHYTGVYLTDVHLGEGRSEQSYVRFQATIDEINRLEPLPAFCWVGGDITLQGGKGSKYVELMSQLKMPVRNAVGNHEMLVRESNPRTRFEQLFGPTYYSFDVGQVHYVTLDGCHVRPEAEGYKNVEGLLSPRELHWLAEDLRHVPDGLRTVASIHIPLVSDYPERRGTTRANVPWWVVRNADEVVDLLARHRVSLVLQGHLHENQRSVRQGIEFVESISVCGRWWKATEGTRENGVSGEPRGYRILEIDGSRIKHRYQSSAEARLDAIGEIVGRPAQLAPHQEAMIAVNVFDQGPQAVVEGRLDDGPPERLRPGTHLRYHEDLQPAHHWAWTIPGSLLTPGRHVLKVHVREPDAPLHQFEHAVIV